jgi:hypothetical protein
MRSLNTQTRFGGLREKIVFARLAPSRKANRSKRASLRLALLTPDATKPSALLYNKAFGAVVRRIGDNVIGTTIIIKKIHTGLAEAAAVQIGTDHPDADCLKDTRHSSVATGALPNIAAEFLVFD